jgi:hypothetical protein
VVDLPAATEESLHGLTVTGIQVDYPDGRHFFLQSLQFLRITADGRYPGPFYCQHLCQCPANT